MQNPRRPGQEQPPLAVPLDAQGWEAFWRIVAQVAFESHERTRKMREAAGGVPASGLRDYEQAAAWLGVSVKWLQQKVQDGSVRHTRLGRHVRFTQEHLDEIVRAGERGPDPVNRSGAITSHRTREEIEMMRPRRRPSRGAGSNNPSPGRSKPP